MRCHNEDRLRRIQRLHTAPKAGSQIIISQKRGDKSKMCILVMTYYVRVEAYVAIILSIFVCPHGTTHLRIVGFCLNLVFMG
jgi:hypothetical protein